MTKISGTERWGLVTHMGHGIAEVAAETHLLLFGEALFAEDEQEMLENGCFELRDLRRCQRLGRVDAPDFGAESATGWDDLHQS